MKTMFRSTKGFTLLEVLIVIVILAVLAGLAVPVYTAQLEKSRAQEAIQMLEAIRGGMLRYFASFGTYVGAVVRTNGGAVVAANIDVDANNIGGGQNQLFDYTLGGLGLNAFTATATRLAAGRPAGAAAVGPAIGATITIVENGSVQRSAVYQ